jgi:hydrogenase maturation protein HypF
MAPFTMCADCRAEYEDPADRRFHAQPIACPACGPRLRALDPKGASVPGSALAAATEALRTGRIVAVKGIGGYHLACCAADDAVVRELRRRKKRDEKPFAVMVRDIPAAEALCALSDDERALLTSAARPIVLLRRRPGTRVAPAVAPGRPDLGILLPYTPLHHLLLEDRGGDPIVLTSGNRSDEPIAYEDGDALERLGSIADLFLVHDRAIHTRCDDSVFRVTGPDGPPTPIRRSRGYAPTSLSLRTPVTRPTLAMGGHLKATFALATGTHAVVSHHLGDLDNWQALRAYRAALDQYTSLFRTVPTRIVHDTHPDYASTREALARAAGGAAVVSVQHHHAHMASAMADAGLPGPAIGVCFDGAGFGDDGAIWGGEVLVGGYARVRRAAHLAYVAMPGGERAMREPWRMALAHLGASGVPVTETPLPARLSRESLTDVQLLLGRGVGCPKTSSVGRLFDAVAALLGLCDVVSFEGQAAMALEALAGAGGTDRGTDDGYSFGILRHDRTMVFDAAPVIRAIVDDQRRGDDPAAIARRFHEGLAAVVADLCVAAAARSEIRDVVLTGGVFVNARLADRVVRRLRAAGLRPHRHARVPPNDGGLCLGQLAVVAGLDAVEV